MINKYNAVQLSLKKKGFFGVKASRTSWAPPPIVSHIVTKIASFQVRVRQGEVEDDGQMLSDTVGDDQEGFDVE